MSRILKRQIIEALDRDGADTVLAVLDNMSARQAITPLISAIYSQNPRIRWNAITALGKTIGRMASEDDMEHARTIMRRLIWSLNDESGGIGWGAPETMAEAMVNHHGLYEEYVRILLSYIREDGNFLEYPPLRRGALWGIGRLGYADPTILKEIESRKYLRDYLSDRDAQSRGLAAWALGALGEEEDIPALEKLAAQNDPVEIFLQGRLRAFTTGEVARNSIESLSSSLC